MFSLLIVEDEELIRKGMRHCLDWAAFQINRIDEAADGVEGLELAKAIRPDIIITDVVMAEMDGIEFVRRLRQEITDKNIRVIIISGHEDVEYVKAALKLQVIDYLLKPFHAEELETLLRKVLLECEAERKQHARVDFLEMRMEQSHAIVRERFIQDLCYRQLTSGDIDVYMDYLDESFKENGPFWAVYIECEELFSSTAEAIRKRLSSLSLFLIDSGIYGGICSDEQWLENDIFVDLLPELKLRIGIGSRVESLADIHHSFQQARVSLIYQPLATDGAVIVTYQSEPGDIKEGLLSEIASQEAAILRIMESDDRTALAKSILTYSEIVARFDRNNITYLQAFCCMLLVQVKQHFAMLVEDSSKTSISTALKQMSIFNDRSGLEQHLLKTLEDLTIVINSKPDQRKVVRLVQDYVQGAFREELTLAQVASQVHLSPNYLANLYKKETGITVNDCITSVRLSEAKRLLQVDKTILIHDLAERVGYKDGKYFTKLFKREIGMNPSEYREKTR